MCVTVVVYIACVGVSIGSHGGYEHVKEDVYCMSCHVFSFNVGCCTYDLLTIEVSL